MTVKLTIIGMGQIGTSVGLALTEHKDKIFRLGYDLEMRIAQQAQKMGALDKVSANLPASVREADIVLLALPADQIHETLQIIAEDLKEGAVVMDTAPVKEVIAAWADELLPKGRYYVGLTPVINPAYLQSHESGVEAAHADLFRGGLIAIVTPPELPSEAIKLAADLTRLLGSDPFFADPVEVDSFMAATHILPQLLAAALINSTVEQPGWREARKLAGRAFAEVTGPIVQLGEPSALSTAAMLSQENVLRVTDSVIAALQSLRNDIKNNEHEALTERLVRARDGRQRWWNERLAANWSSEENGPHAELPRSSEFFSRLINIGLNKHSKDRKSKS